MAGFLVPLTLYICALVLASAQLIPVEQHKLFIRTSHEDTFVNIFAHMCIVATSDYILELDETSEVCQTTVIGDTQELALIFAQALHHALGDATIMFDYLDIFLCISQDIATGEHAHQPQADVILSHQTFMLRDTPPTCSKSWRSSQLSTFLQPTH